MHDHHVTAAFLEMADEQDRPLEELLERAEHLLGCRECIHRLRAVRLPFEAEQLARFIDEQESHDAVELGRGQTYRFMAEAFDPQIRKAVAHHEANHLLTLDPLEARVAVCTARARMRTPELARELFERCRREVTRDPGRALEIAILLEEVAARLPERYTDATKRELRALALAGRANALRAAADLRAADGAIGEALELREQCEPGVRAEIASLAASLRKDQRRFEESEGLLAEALEIYEELEDEHLQGKTLLKRGSLLFYGGKVDSAIECVTEAMGRLDGSRDPRVVFCAHHNLATYLCEAGRFEEAEAVLEKSSELYERFADFYSVLRRRWLMARIAQASGRTPEAENLLQQIQRGFAEEGLGYDAALVTLHLAELYAEQGRVRELKELAREMVPIFQAQDIDREALAALLLFHRAASSEALTLTLVQEVRAHLQNSRGNSSLRFQRSTDRSRGLR